jgi:hypothetical protein
VDKQKGMIRMRLQLLNREALRAPSLVPKVLMKPQWRKCPARDLFLGEKNAIVLHSDRAPGLSGYVPNHASSSG